MTDLEQLLRQDLDRSAEAHPVALSSADVLAAGQAHVRRRTARRTAAGLCLTLAVGGGGIGLSRLPDRAPLVAASPTPLRTGVGTATLPLAGTVEGRAYQGWQVEVDRAAVDAAAPAPAGMGSLRFAAVDGQGHALVQVVGDVHGVERTGAVVVRGAGAARSHLIGVVDAPAVTFRRLVTDQPATAGGTQGAQQQVSGTDLTAFVDRSDSSDADLARTRVRGVLWGTPDGQVHASDGTRRLAVPSVVLTTDDGPTTVYVSDDLHLLGARGRLGDYAVDTRDGARPPVVGGVTRVGPQARGMTVGLLPAGAHDIRLDHPLPRPTQIPVTTRTLPDGRVVWASAGPVPEQLTSGAGELSSQVTWTDAQGVRHTFDPAR